MFQLEQSLENRRANIEYKILWKTQPFVFDRKDSRLIVAFARIGRAVASGIVLHRSFEVTRQRQTNSATDGQTAGQVHR